MLPFTGNAFAFEVETKAKEPGEPALATSLNWKLFMVKALPTTLPVKTTWFTPPTNALLATTPRFAAFTAFITAVVT